jgi:hypothetical protein
MKNRVRAFFGKPEPLERGRRQKKKELTASEIEDAAKNACFVLEEGDEIEFVVSVGSADSPVDFMAMRWGQPGKMKTRARIRFEDTGRKLVWDVEDNHNLDSIVATFVDDGVQPQVFHGGTFKDYLQWTKDANMLLKEGGNAADPWRPAAEVIAEMKS